MFLSTGFTGVVSRVHFYGIIGLNICIITNFLIKILAIFLNLMMPFLGNFLFFERKYALYFVSVFMNFFSAYFEAHYLSHAYLSLMSWLFVFVFWSMLIYSTNDILRTSTNPSFKFMRFIEAAIPLLAMYYFLSSVG